MRDRFDPTKILGELAEGLPPEEEAALMDALATFADDLTPLRPPAGLKARLMRSVARPSHAFADRMAALLDLGVEKVNAILDSAATGLGWEPSGPGCLLLHLQGGPALSEAVAGLVKVEAGLRFPRHVHLGQEYVLVLQGGLEDESGRVSLPGDLVPMPPGSEHAFTALPGEDLLYLAVVYEGVDFSPAGGGVILPRGRTA